MFLCVGFVTRVTQPKRPLSDFVCYLQARVSGIITYNVSVGLLTVGNIFIISVANVHGFRLHALLTYVMEYVKGKYVPVHAMKVCRGSRGIAPLILILGNRWR
jgi:hypothetical protein